MRPIKKKTAHHKSWGSWPKMRIQEFWRGQDGGKLKTFGKPTINTKNTEEVGRNGRGAEGNKTPAHKSLMF